MAEIIKSWQNLKSRRKIINRQKLQFALEDIFKQDISPNERRILCIKTYKETLDNAFLEVKGRFMANQNGALAVAGNCFIIDQLLRVIFHMAAVHLYPVANPTKSELICFTAVGGYGRGELAPHSDVDILFLHDYKQTPRVEQLVEETLYTLWDLGLKIGHSTRSIDDCIRLSKQDNTIATSILEARYICGEASLFDELRKKFIKQIVDGRAKEFMQLKLAERDERHQRMGDSRYVLEPNIKDGKGGLRDLHTLYWVAKFLYFVQDISQLVAMGKLTKKEANNFTKAQGFLWTLRCHLHYLTNRPEERLSFDVQPELANIMGYKDHAGSIGVERFMKHYFLIAKEVGDLTRIFCAAFEANSQRRKLLHIPLKIFRKNIDGFPIDDDRLSINNGKHFHDIPIDMLRIFLTAQESGLEIHPFAMQSVTRNLKRITNKIRKDFQANRIFRKILCSDDDPEINLRHMNECGLLGRFVPEFGRVVAQMQYDMYHVYTTDEHTIRAIGLLNRIENGLLKKDHPVASKIIGKVLSRRVLYFAVFLHDIAKGRGGDHSVLGAKVAEKLCPIFGMNEEQTETVAWLIKNHLIMSNTAFKRDLDDPRTIERFVEQVKSPERLRLLLCLTVADIRAVGPNVWNGWKATLLRDLYEYTEDYMSGGLSSEGHTEMQERAKINLSQALENDGWQQNDINAHLARGRGSYFLSYDVDNMLRHAKFIHNAELNQQQLNIELSEIKDAQASDLMIYAADHPGLFSRLSGAVALSGGTIMTAKIHTLSCGMALDCFIIQDAKGGAFTKKIKIKRLSDNIRKIMAGEIKPLEEFEKKALASSLIKKRRAIFKVKPRVLIDNKASNTYTLIEINGRDRLGLLFLLTICLTRLGLTIAKAKISTFGEQVVDVFYVKNVFGLKIDHIDKINQINKELLKILSKENKGMKR